MCFVSCLVWAMPWAARAGSARMPRYCEYWEDVGVVQGEDLWEWRGRIGSSSSGGRAGINGAEKGKLLLLCRFARALLSSSVEWVGAVDEQHADHSTVNHLIRSRINCTSLAKSDKTQGKTPHSKYKVRPLGPLTPSPKPLAPNKPVQTFTNFLSSISISISLRRTMYDYQHMWHNPSGGAYHYGETYGSPYDSSKSWSPINMTTVDYNCPPDPSSYMYGPQFGECFVQEKGSLLGRILRAVFCLA